MYQERFEMISRVARRITSSFDIRHILESVRDEAKAAVPNLNEVCLLVTGPDAENHLAPHQCRGASEANTCQLCESGWPTIPEEQADAAESACCAAQADNATHLPSDSPPDGLSEVLLPIYDGVEPIAYVDATAKTGTTLEEHDLILLKDLADLATNVIIGARHHRRLTEEKTVLYRKLEHFRPFVPATAQEIIETNPDAPLLEKREKDVSILFLDVADYTLISEVLGREKVDFILERYFSSFLDEIYTYGGDINETAGDGLMVIFQGTPEEHAANAVRTALGIHRRTAQINAELDPPTGPVLVNVGINSGVASVGMTRFQGSAGTRTTFTATGPTTNLASRIASAAIGGDILIGPETARRVQNEFSIRDKGIRHFKNMREPVRVFSPLPF